MWNTPTCISAKQYGRRLGNRNNNEKLCSDLWFVFLYLLTHLRSMPKTYTNYAPYSIIFNWNYHRCMHRQTIPQLSGVTSAVVGDWKQANKDRTTFMWSLVRTEPGKKTNAGKQKSFSIFLMSQAANKKPVKNVISEIWYKLRMWMRERKKVEGWIKLCSPHRNQMNRICDDVRREKTHTIRLNYIAWFGCTKTGCELRKVDEWKEYEPRSWAWDIQSNVRSIDNIQTTL